MSNLVIVESPTKARTIGKYLGKEYEIKASMGHVVDLPKSKLGVDLENNFEPQYEVVADKKKILAELKAALKNADSVILATDPDREGEAIAFHVADLLKIPQSKRKRMVFHEITKEAVEEALQNPREVDTNLVDAQTARRVLDRLVGYKLSPMLWQKVRRGLSAGRVQSVALRLIVEREREIEKFKKEPYFTINVDLSNSERRMTQNNTQNDAEKDTGVVSRSVPQSSATTTFELIEIDGKKIETQETHSLYDGEYTVTKTTITTKDAAEKILADLSHASLGSRSARSRVLLGSRSARHYMVSDVVQKEMRRSPQAPYTTSTLQQDASRRMGLAGRRTMSLAQKLYEEGYITYHRTDSVAMAKSAQVAIVSYVKSEFGEKYVSPRAYSTKQKLAQEAHEAVRPTNVKTSSASVSQDLGEGYGKLYELIWRRAVASQMADAITESTTVIVDTVSENSEYSANQIISKSDNQQMRKSESSEDLKHRNSDTQSFLSVPAYRLKANGSVLVFDGFLKINPQALQDNRLPEFTAGENLTFVNAEEMPHETTPPPRYNDASLIKTLEEKGIGRPSTYASIISVIEDRKYVDRMEARFSPTVIGIAVNDFLVQHFSGIDDIPFTAEMEDMLDDIAQGKRKWQPEMKKFYDPFEKQLAKVKDAARVKIEVEKTGEKCPECKEGEIVIRMGRFGKFFSCDRFPECKYTKQYVEETGLTCPKDSGNVIIKKTRKGRTFYGCSNYPACTFAAWKLTDITSSKT